MNRRMVRTVKVVSLWLGAGALLSTATCVRDLTDLVGTGISLSTLTGAYGEGSQAVSTIGAGFDLVSDLMRFARLII